MYRRSRLSRSREGGMSKSTLEGGTDLGKGGVTVLVVLSVQSAQCV